MKAGPNYLHCFAFYLVNNNLFTLTNEFCFVVGGATTQIGETSFGYFCCFVRTFWVVKSTAYNVYSPKKRKPFAGFSQFSDRKEEWQIQETISMISSTYSICQSSVNRFEHSNWKITFEFFWNLCDTKKSSALTLILQWCQWFG